mmetsp:Transcript_14792/g.30452  ORF Transcript_14792/g.30452 Transcript_14792/m.30452 type:complete len:381 (-) Transcript_14792:45-1187(-)
MPASYKLLDTHHEGSHASPNSSLTCLRFVLVATVIALAIVLFASSPSPPTSRPSSAPLKVLVDTDIGTDIDDTWAIAVLLSLHASKTIEIVAFVTSTFDTLGRAKVLAKFLTDAVKAPTVPIIVGKSTPVSEAYAQAGEQAGLDYGANFDLSTYPTVILEADWWKYTTELMDETPDLLFLELAPPDNFAALDKSIPVVGMSGSIAKGYDGISEPSVEFNVVGFEGGSTEYSCELYREALDLTLTPLDTCGDFIIDGSQYQQLVKQRADNPVVSAVLDHYESWAAHDPYNGAYGPLHPDTTSTVLFDVVAVALMAQKEKVLGGGEWMRLQETSVAIEEDGMIVQVEEGQEGECGGRVLEALEWTNKGKINARQWVLNLLLR